MAGLDDVFGSGEEDGVAVEDLSHRMEMGRAEGSERQASSIPWVFDRFTDMGLYKPWIGR